MASETVNMTQDTRLEDIFRKLNGGRETKAALTNLSMIYKRVRSTFGTEFAPDFRT